ncbi:hypothetical protein EV179_002901 [Coemansia sp. RSA 487]|nr:hypothetical protein EV179_002901 [Coemansia sp. RSA 487]
MSENTNTEGDTVCSGDVELYDEYYNVCPSESTNQLPEVVLSEEKFGFIDENMIPAMCSKCVNIQDNVATMLACIIVVCEDFDASNSLSPNKSNIGNLQLAGNRSGKTRQRLRRRNFQGPSIQPNLNKNVNQNESTTSTQPSSTSSDMYSSSISETSSGNYEGSDSGSGEIFSGDGTYFTPGLGSCGKTNAEDEFIAAINAPQYGTYANPNNAPVCGRCALVKGALGRVKVTITDKCPPCKHGDLDLSPVAFMEIGDMDDGTFANSAAEERVMQIRMGRLRRRRDCNKVNVQNNNNNNEIDQNYPSSLSEESSSANEPSSESGEEFTGTLTNYNVEENEGACGGMNTNDEMVAALNSAQFKADDNGSSVYCGVCATIMGDKATIVVKIVDECPTCQDNDLDLSPAAFAAATTADGMAKNIKWQSTGTTGFAHGRRQEPLARVVAGLQPLAAICRSWRKAVVPLLYQTAVCSVHQRALLINDEECDTLRYVCSTNVDLIVRGGYERYVRRLAIDLVGDVAPGFPVMQLEEAGFSRTLWPQTNELQVDHWHGYQQQRSKILPESVSKLNAYLLHNLPNLTSVEYNSLGDHRSYGDFPLNGLLASTLSRLTELRIHSGLVPDLGAAAFLPMLSSLTLNCPMVSCAAHLPQIFAESLAYLRIGFSSSETIWNRFYVGQGKRGVIFAKLRSLELEYTTPVIEDPCRCKGSSRRRCTGKQITLLSSKTYRLAGGPDESALGQGASKGGNRLDSVYYHSTDDEGGDDAASSSDYEEFWATSSDGESLTGKAASSGSKKPRSSGKPSFPQLEKLYIRKYPYPVTDILQHFAVDRIPHVSIRDVGRRSWVAGLAAEYAGNMRTLRVDVARSSSSSGHHLLQREEREERHYQVWINRLFSMSSATLKNLWLDAPTTAPVTLPDIVGLTNLTELSLGMKMDLGTVPNLLARLQQLHKLAIHVHPQSSWLERNEGVLGGGYDQQGENDDAHMLGRLPSLSTSLRCLTVYTGMVDFSRLDCHGTHKRSLSTSNKCCRRRCRFCEKCIGMAAMVPDHCEDQFTDKGGEKYEALGSVVMAVERELVWMIARISSLVVLKTERSTSRAIKKCISELMSHKTASSQIGNLDRLRITEWEYY